jgi:hypothetical protein
MHLASHLRLRWIFAVAVAAAAVPALAADAPARALFVTGQVTAVRDGQQRPLYKGAEIDVGDEIRTGLASNVQIRFSDASIVSLKPQTNFVVANYYFNGREDGSERVFFNLLRGGLRTVTGLIGHANQANYKVTTPTATIGIRGTVWSATHCVSDECKNDDGTTAKPGTYGEVKSGAIALSNDTPEVVFGAHTAFYVADRSSAPQRLLVAPSFVAIGLQMRASTSSSTSAAAGNFGAAQDSLTTTTSSSAASGAPTSTSSTAIGSSGVPTAAQLGFVASNNTSSSGTSSVLPASNTSTTGTTGTISGVTGFIAGYTVNTDTTDGVISGNGGNENYAPVTSYSISSDGHLLSYSSSLGPQALTQTATPANIQTMQIDSGMLLIGQLVGDYRGTSSSGTGFSGPGGFLYIETNSPLVNNNSNGPTSGVFTFGGPGAFIGLAADAAGNTATFSRFTATFNVGTGALSFAATANFASIAGYGPASLSITGSATESPGSSNSQGTFPLTATCTGSGCFEPSATGSWNANFITSATTIPAAVLTGSLFNATRNSGTGNAVIFVGGLKCVSGHC